MRERKAVTRNRAILSIVSVIILCCFMTACGKLIVGVRVAIRMAGGTETVTGISDEEIK